VGETRLADRLDFEIAVELEAGLITGHAGVPGLIEAFRQTGTAAGNGPGDQAEEPQARAEYIGDGGKPAGDVGGGW